MSETQKAQLLARWLDESPGTSAPEDLDADVVEAVLALRPDLAPAPRLSVLDILDAVTDGPLTGPDALPSPEEEIAAARFAELLDEGVGDEEDPGLEALFAMRPDLAPPPRVSVFEIVGGLSRGPLADQTLGETMPTLPPGTGELPVALEAANTVPPEAGVRPPRRGFWVWLWPGPLALAAAALVLFMVLPVAPELPTGFPMPAPAVQSAPMAEAPPMEAPTDTPAKEEVFAEASPAEPLGEPSLGPAPDASAAPAQPESTTRSNSELFKSADVQAQAPSGAAGGAAAGLTAEPLAEAKPADMRALDDEESLGGDALVGAPATEVTTATTTAERSQTRQPMRSVLASKAPSTPSAAAPAPFAATPPPPPRPAPRTIAEATNEDFDAAPAASSGAYDLADDEAVGRRKDARRDGGERRAEREEGAEAGETPDRRQLARANRALALGDMDTAEVRLRPLLTSTDRPVVVEASLRLCRIYIAQGRLDEARKTVAIGLAAGPEPERLYAELIQISQQLGP